jgi:hypothetical protein
MPADAGKVIELVPQQKQAFHVIHSTGAPLTLGVRDFSVATLVSP